MENKRESKPSNPQTQKSDPSKIILIVIVVLLLGAIGYLVFNNQKTEEKVVTYVKQHETDSIDVAKKVKDIENLQSELEKLKAEKEALGLSVDSLNTQLAELESLKSKVRSKQITINKLNAELSKAQGGYISMKSTYDSLVAQNNDLSRKKDSLITLNRNKEDSLNNLRAKNAEFAQKVALASILRAENIKVAVVNSKGKEEKIVPIYKVKSLAKLKVSFNLADNPVASHEEKDIYFRLVEPSGSTIFEGDKIFTLEGKEAFYTDKQTVNFSNSKQQVTFFYHKGSAYKPGKYTIELFAEGHKIGDTFLTLK